MELLVSEKNTQIDIPRNNGSIQYTLLFTRNYHDTLI